MRVCPEDLEVCRRQECGTGRCRRTGESPLSVCFECGELTTIRTAVTVCVTCVCEYRPYEEEA